MFSVLVKSCGSYGPNPSRVGSSSTKVTLTMDLVYTCYSPPEARQEANSPTKGFSSFPCGALSSVSSKNVLIFSTKTCHPHDHDSNTTAIPKMGLYSVFCCDLNTPWDLYLVCIRNVEVTALAWDEEGQRIALGDAAGSAEIWEMPDPGIISCWKCVAKEIFTQEKWIAAKFCCRRRKPYLCSEQYGTRQYCDKYTFSPSAERQSHLNALNMRGMTTCMFVSSSALVMCIAIGKSLVGYRHVTAVLGVRQRIKSADLTYLRDGQMAVAISNGSPLFPIRLFTLTPSYRVPKQGISRTPDLELAVSEIAPIHLHQNKEQGGSGKISSDETITGISGVRFVKGLDCDALLLSTDTASGGRVELWELKAIVQHVHKVFSQLSEGSCTNSSKVTTPVWHFVEVYSGPNSPVVAMATPMMSMQRGPAAPCYITVAYADGTIQCLLKDALQRVSTVELPKGGNMPTDCTPPSAKVSRSSDGSSTGAVKISSLSFTSTANALVVLDSFGQMYVYRMSPISDPCGLYTPPYLVTALEYCLVSGVDPWDLTLCINPGDIEKICDKLQENFDGQKESNRKYYYAKLMSLKASLYRLVPSLEYRAADCYLSIILFSIPGIFSSIMRTSANSNEFWMDDMKTTIYDTVTRTLESQTDEIDVDKMANVLSTQFSFSSVEDSILDHMVHLVQWTATFALHLMAGVPEFRSSRKGPGYDMHKDLNVLSTLRQLLLLIRMLSRSRPELSPTFTKSLDSFDVVAKLFALVTKQRDPSSADDSLHVDDCLRLSSLVLIPPLPSVSCIRARGVAPRAAAAASAHSYTFRAPPTQLQYEFGTDPDGDLGQSGFNPGTFGESQEMIAPFIDGAMFGNQLRVDNLRQAYLGRKPYSILQSTRCCAITSSTNSNNESWDKKLIIDPPWAGNWKLKRLE